MTTPTLFNIGRKKRILTMLDFDDCLLPNTIAYYQPVLRDMLKQSLRLIKPNLTDEEYLEGEATSLALYGSYFKHWELTVAPEPGWTNSVYRPMIPEQVKAIKAGLKPDPAVAKALGELTENGHTVYIVTHSYFEYCWPLAEHAGYSQFIPPERVIDLARADHQYKSSGHPYRLVRQLEGTEFDVTNMADDVVANLKPLREMNILGHYISEHAPKPEHIGHFDFHHETILSALKQMAQQGE